MATCGKCKSRNVDVAHVKACYSGVREVVRVPWVKPTVKPDPSERVAADVQAFAKPSEAFMSDVDAEQLDFLAGLPEFHALRLELLEQAEQEGGESKDQLEEERVELQERLDEDRFLAERTLGWQGRRLFDVAQSEREEGWGERTLEADVDSTWQVADSRTRYNQRSSTDVLVDGPRYFRSMFAPRVKDVSQLWRIELWRLGMLCPTHNEEYRDCGC